MEQRRWLKIAILMSLLAMSCSRELKVKHKDNLPVYNHTIATILVEYASAVYLSDLTELFTWTCSRCDDLTEGFEVIELIVDVEHCLQGFVGVAKDLNVNHETQNVQVVTFGQPRIGNSAFVAYYSELVPNTFRVTNEHDIVPHLPPYYPHLTQKTYHHFPTEVWLYNAGFGSLVYPVEKVCDDSGEDPSCSRSVMGNSISDHLEYYGVELGGDTPRTCRIVMDPRVAEYGVQDLGGNFILSRDPSTSVVKLKIESSIPSNVI
ncbi:hypothetical protein CsSME_00021122 [Camellia sinensis var. sinensis]